MNRADDGYVDRVSDRSFQIDDSRDTENDSLRNADKMSSFDTSRPAEENYTVGYVNIVETVRDIDRVRDAQ